MYQPLICGVVARPHRRDDDARCLAAPLDPEDLQRLAHALVYGVRQDPQPQGDFLRRPVLVDQHQALPLPLAQARDEKFDRIRHDRVPDMQRQCSHTASP